MKIRCSQLPLLSECAASAHSEVSINTTSEAAGLGTILHRQISDFITGKAVEVSDELDWFKSAWTSLNVQDVKAEVPVNVEFDGVEYSGHIDAVCNNGNLLIDWKTGRGETDYRPQMIGYAYLWLRSKILDPNCGDFVITVAIINTTTKTVWSETLTSDQIASEFLSIHRRINDWDGYYSVGDHCKYCPARLFCQANITSLNSALALIGESGISQQIDPARLVDVYPLLGQMESRLKAAKDFIRDQVVMQGGKIESPSGTLELQQIRRAEVSVVECAGYLQGLLGQEEFFGLLKAGIGDVEKALIDKYRNESPEHVLESEADLTTTKNGKLVKLTQDLQKKWLRERLEGLDAITYSTTQKLNFKPAKKEIESE